MFAIESAQLSSLTTIQTSFSSAILVSGVLRRDKCHLPAILHDSGLFQLSDENLRGIRPCRVLMHQRRPGCISQRLAAKTRARTFRPSTVGRPVSTAFLFGPGKVGLCLNLELFLNKLWSFKNTPFEKSTSTNLS